MKIVVGLGNPGRQYEETRHNVGWMVLDRLADRGGLSGRAKAREAAAVVRGRVAGLDLVLVKPTTYMNLSGVAVRKVLARERAPLEDMLVVVDDFALPLGRLRLREQGSAGGHNGLRSIIGEMGNQKFARLRVGIGEPDRNARDHVLSRFRDAERPLVDEVIDAAADAVLDWAREGANRTASRWNAWTPAAPRVAHEDTPDEGPPDEGPPDSPAAGRPARVPESATAGGSTIIRRLTGWRKVLPRGERDEFGTRRDG